MVGVEVGFGVGVGVSVGGGVGRMVGEGVDGGIGGGVGGVVLSVGITLGITELGDDGPKDGFPERFVDWDNVGRVVCSKLGSSLGRSLGFFHGVALGNTGEKGRPDGSTDG